MTPQDFNFVRVNQTRTQSGALTNNCKTSVKICKSEIIWLVLIQIQKNTLQCSSKMWWFLLVLSIFIDNSNSQVLRTETQVLYYQVGE